MPNNDNKEKITRKLSAILSADVKGYSLLMADDEIHTIQTLKAYRDLMSDLINRHSGRVVDNPGDNLLAEFGSAVDAVECAVKIQKKLEKENAKFVEDKRLQFRIGINIGDVVHDGNRIYGSGVNVAARIEGLADAGGVCISRGTYDQVKNKLTHDCEYLGEYDVKNITELVRVYRVMMDSDAPKPLVEEELELPDKPSIAVLPFDNMSGDPDQEYFSDGITEDIITALSRSPWMFVIARNSSFSYRGKAVDAKIISRELGVKYILEGSVRKAGNTIRVTAQLIDGTNGKHVWAEKYDGELQDIFHLQDQITQRVVASAQTQIQKHVSDKTNAVEHPDVVTWDQIARGMKSYYELSKDSLVAAENIFRKVTNSDPKSCIAKYSLAGVLIHQVFMGYASNAKAKTSEALELAECAIALNEEDEYAHWTLGLIQDILDNHELAISELRRALEINPNCSNAYGVLGGFISIKNPDESIKYSEIAIRTNPRDPSIFFRFSSIATAHFAAGRYSEAAQWANKSIHRKPGWRLGHAFLVASLVQLNQFENANEAVKNYLECVPSETISGLCKDVLGVEGKVVLRVIESLRLAGLPE